MEKFFYEVRPYAFAGMALKFIFNSTYSSALMQASCLLLLAVTSIIIGARLQHRGRISR